MNNTATNGATNMTTDQMTAEIARLTAENARLRGEGHHFPRAYDSTPYTIDATITPKVSIMLEGERPNYDVLDATRGAGRHKVMAFSQTFKIGDQAVYDGFNFCYFGEIVAIGPKTITIEAHGRKRRLTVERFAFWNRRDARFCHDERRGWSD